MLKRIANGVLKTNLIILVLLTFISGISHGAQNTDTLTLAKQLNAKGKYTASIKLLKPYYDHHPGNLSAQWIYAQTLYWGKRYKKAEAVYEYAIKWHPENYYLRLDYAIKLVDIGELDKALPILNLYLKYDSTASDVHLALAKIDLWKGDVGAADKELAKVQKKDPKNAKALAMRREILTDEASWLKISAGYYSDDQPEKKIAGCIDAGVHLNELATLHFNFLSPVLLGNSSVYNTQWLQAGSIFNLAKVGLKLELNAGIIRLPNGKFSGTGNIELNKTFVKYLLLTVKAEHKPYLNALANLTNPIMEMHYNAAIGWINTNSVQGRISFDADQFYSDANVVYTASGWIMTPPLKLSVFEFRLGYGYNYSTSEASRYQSTQTLAQIEHSWDSTYKIPGAYTPYFTPYKQSVNSAILSINIHPAKIVDIGLKGNIGFYATAQNPYLYLNRATNDSTVIARGFAKTHFVPGEANLYIAVQVTPKVSIRGEYKFFATNFYTSNYGGITAQINFWNERKKQ